VRLCLKNQTRVRVQVLEKFISLMSLNTILISTGRYMFILVPLVGNEINGISRVRNLDFCKLGHILVVIFLFNE